MNIEAAEAAFICCGVSVLLMILTGWGPFGMSTIILFVAAICIWLLEGRK